MNFDAASETPRLQRREGGDDAINVGLGAKQAGMRILRRLPNEMLSPAEAYFEPNFVDWLGKNTRQLFCAELAAHIDFVVRQALPQQLRLAL